MTAAAFDCPVCPRRGLTAAARQCPGCGVDLVPLWRVRELPDAYVADALAHLEGGRIDEAVLSLHAAIALADTPERRLLLGDALSRAKEQGGLGATDARHGAEAPTAALTPPSEPRRRRRLLAAGLTVLALAAAGSAVALRRPQEAAVAAPSVTDVAAVSTSPIRAGPTPATIDGMAAVDGVRVRQAGGMTIAVVDSDVFAPGGAAILPEARGALAGLGAVLRDTPTMLIVEGHTDGKSVRPGGRWRSNASLALARAAAAITALEETGIPGDRLAAAAVPGSHPRRSVAIRVIPLP